MRARVRTALLLRHSYLRKPLSQCSRIARLSVLDEPDAQRLEGHLECLRQIAQHLEVDAAVGDGVAQHVAGHQDVAGEFVGFPFDDGGGVETGDFLLDLVEDGGHGDLDVKGCGLRF